MYKLFFISVVFINHSSILLLFLSPHPGAGGAGRLDRENPEDHRLWSGQRMAPDHQDECSGDVRLDGPRGHQALPLLQEQRRLEVLHSRFSSLHLIYTNCFRQIEIRDKVSVSAPVPSSYFINLSVLFCLENLNNKYLLTTTVR